MVGPGSALCVRYAALVQREREGLASNCVVHLKRTGQKSRKLGNSLKTGFVHVDHHVENDRSKTTVQAHTSLE
jgi:hypothetical protein